MRKYKTQKKRKGERKGERREVRSGRILNLQRRE
jgi:hypothetical protein